MSAVISSCGKYRFRLGRVWDEFNPRRVLWVMLNPSTADAELDDPTIRRCIDFSKDWGYGGLFVGNLFALRSTDPKALFTANDPYGLSACNGIHNGMHIQEMMAASEQIIAAWGAHPSIGKTDLDQWQRQLGDQGVRTIYCLGTTKSGAPKHPLYLPKNSQRIVWDAP